MGRPRKAPPISGAGAVTGSSAISGEVPDLAQIRFNLSISHPYFQRVIYQMITVETDKVPTLAVDKYWRFYFNPKCLQSMTLDEATAAVVHEINHLIRNHHARFDRCQYPKLANIAEDMEINDDIREEGLKLPSWVVYPDSKMYGYPLHLHAEEYYEKLLQDAPKLFKCNGQHADGDDSNGVPGQCNCPEGASNPKNGKVGNGGCGSAAANKGEWELDNGGEDATSDKDADGNDVPRVEPWMQDSVKRDTAAQIKEAAKCRGNVPGGLLRWADDYLKPWVDWRKELRAVTCSALNVVEGMMDYSFKKRHRKQEAYKDFVKQGFIAYAPNVAVIADTSGSMSDKDIGQAIAEIGSILKATRARIQFVSCDADVNFSAKISNKHQVQFKGGGGTDMRIAFKHLDTVKPKADIILIVTDGYTPWPAERNKGCKKTIAVITQNGTTESMPAWIHPIKIDERKK